MIVTTALTPAGGYEYKVAIQLSETAGIAAKIVRVELAPTDAWGPYPPIATFGAEAWEGDGTIPAHGTLSLRPLQTTVETIFDYYRPLEATVVFSDTTSAASREAWLVDSTQRPPEPPAASRFFLTGKVVDGANRALPDVTVELFDGANAGRTATTDADGIFRLTDLGPGKCSVRFSKQGHASTFTSIELMSNLSFNYRLTTQ